MAISPSRAAGDAYDLVVVGGGLYGACMALEAARCGLRPVLLEGQDFGGASSANALPVVRGGLRRLGELGLGRCVEAAREQQWFLRQLPDLVQPLACLMPFGGRIGRHPMVVNAAMRLYEWLVQRPDDTYAHTAEGRLIRPSEIAACMHQPGPAKFGSAAVWQEAVISKPHRLVVELLGWAARCGAVCLNYTQVEQVVTRRGRVTGVLARDRSSDTLLEFRAGKVINCAGPWRRSLAAACDADRRSLLNLCLAFNVLLNVPAPCREHALVVAARNRRDRELFFLPHARGVLVGTAYLPWSGEPRLPAVCEDNLFGFVSELSKIAPGLRVGMDNVLRVYAGLVPARRAGSTRPSHRDIFCDHGRLAGPHGLYTLAGAECTRARPMARLLLKQAFRRNPEPAGERCGPPCSTAVSTPRAEEVACPRDRSRAVHAAIRCLVETESVLHLDDLVLRRTDWCDRADLLERIVNTICAALGWDESRRILEKARLALAMRQCHSPMPAAFAGTRSPAVEPVPGNTARL